jgi:hypothetical protein
MQLYTQTRFLLRERVEINDTNIKAQQTLFYVPCVSENAENFST